MVLVESIGSNRLKENGAKFAQIGPIYTPKNSCEDMKLVSQKEMEHQFLRLGFRRENSYMMRKPEIPID